MTPVAQRIDAFLVAALLIGAACPALAARSTTHPPTDALSQASEIAEQIRENAPTIDAAAFNKAMSDVNALDARLAKALSSDRKQALDALVTGIRSACTSGDRSAVGASSLHDVARRRIAASRRPGRGGGRDVIRSVHICSSPVDKGMPPKAIGGEISKARPSSTYPLSSKWNGTHLCVSAPKLRAFARNFGESHFKFADQTCP